MVVLRINLLLFKMIVCIVGVSFWGQCICEYSLGTMLFCNWVWEY
jgi:hypothetical protein